MSYRRIHSPHKRTIVVGDVHGRFKELCAVLDKIGFNSTDVLISVGNFSGQGPLAWKTASFFRETPNAFAVMGSQELKLAGLLNSAPGPERDHAMSLYRILDGNQREWTVFFNSLPAVIESNHAIVTHVRLDPRKKIKNQDTGHTCYVNRENNRIVVDENRIPEWFHQTRSQFGKKPVCIGHCDYKMINMVPGYLYGLGTGATKKRHLWAVVLPGPFVISVPVWDNFTKPNALWSETQTNACGPQY